MRVLQEDGTEHPQAGRLLFSDLSVDPSSGQVTLRAEVPNPGGALLPGLYVRVRLEQDAVTLTVEEGEPVEVSVRGESVTADSLGVRVPLAGQGPTRAVAPIPPPVTNSPTERDLDDPMALASGVGVVPHSWPDDLDDPTGPVPIRR